MILNNVDLTSEQRTQLEELRDEHRAEMQPLHQQMQAKREQMRDLWTAEVLDEAAIWAMDEEMAPLREQLRQKRLEQRLEVMNVLTAEQRAEHFEAMEKRFRQRKFKNR